MSKQLLLAGRRHRHPEASNWRWMERGAGRMGVGVAGPWKRWWVQRGLADPAGTGGHAVGAGGSAGGCIQGVKNSPVQVRAGG